MNDGRLAAGETLSEPTGFLIAAAANPFVDTIARLESKIAAGVGFFQTNIVYDVDRFAEWFAPVVAVGIAERAPFLVGINPPRSTGCSNTWTPTSPVWRSTRPPTRRWPTRAATRRKTPVSASRWRRSEGLRGVDGVSGVHIMAPGWSAEAVVRVVDQAGLSPAK